MKKLYSIVTAVLLAVGAISYAAATGESETVKYSPVPFGTAGYDGYTLNNGSTTVYTDGASITGHGGSRSDNTNLVGSYFYKVAAGNTVTIKAPEGRYITNVETVAYKVGKDTKQNTNWTSITAVEDGVSVSKDNSEYIMAYHDKDGQKLIKTEADMTHLQLPLNNATEVSMTLPTGSKELRVFFNVTYSDGSDTPGPSTTPVYVTWGVLANATMTVGDSQALPAFTANPAEGATVAYSVTGSAVAIENDMIVAKEAGEATVTATATAADGYKLTDAATKTYTITVNAATVEPTPDNTKYVVWGADGVTAPQGTTFTGTAAPTKGTDNDYTLDGVSYTSVKIGGNTNVYTLAAPSGKMFKSVKFYGHRSGTGNAANIRYSATNSQLSSTGKYETLSVGSKSSEKEIVGQALTLPASSTVLYFNPRNTFEIILEVELEDFAVLEQVSVTYGALTSAEMTVGESQDLPSYTVTPDNAATVAYSVSGSAVAIENNKIVAKEAGSATVTATATAANGYALNGEASKAYTITVKAPRPTDDRYISWMGDGVAGPCELIGDGMTAATMHTYIFNGKAYTPIHFATSGKVYALTAPKGKMFKTINVYAYRSSNDTGNIRYSLTSADCSSDYTTFAIPQKRGTAGTAFENVTGVSIPVSTLESITTVYISPRNSNIDMIIEVELVDYVAPQIKKINTVTPEAVEVEVDDNVASPAVVDDMDGVTATYRITSGSDKISIDENGIVTGVKVGTAKVEVTVTPVDGYKWADGTTAAKKVSYTITVKAKSLGLSWVDAADNTMPVSQWTFNHAFVKFENGVEVSNNNTKQPVIYNPKNENLEFSINFPEGTDAFATIDENGVVARINPTEKLTGHAVVTATVVGSEPVQSVSYELSVVNYDGNILSWGNATSKDNWVADPSIPTETNRLNYGGGTKIEVGRVNKAIQAQTNCKFYIDGSVYTAIKVSNGCPTRFKAPDGKIFKKVTIYSAITKNEYTANSNKNANRLTYWKRYNDYAYYVNPDVAAGMVVNGVAMKSEALDGPARADIKNADNQLEIIPDGAYSDHLITSIEGITKDPDHNGCTLPAVWEVIKEGDPTQYIKEFTINNAGTQVCFVAAVEYADIDELQAKLQENSTENDATPDQERKETLKKSQLRKAPNFAFPFLFNDYINVAVDSDFGANGYFVTNNINFGSKGQESFNFEHVWDWKSDFPKVQKEIDEVKIHYASTNPQVATVDENGNVKIHAAGYTYIYCWTDGSIVSANVHNAGETITINGKEYFNDCPAEANIKSRNPYGVPTVWSHGDTDKGDANVAPYKSYTVYYQLGVAPLARPNHNSDAHAEWTDCIKDTEVCEHVLHQIDTPVEIALMHAGFGEGKVVSIHWTMEKIDDAQVAAYAAEPGDIDYSNWTLYDPANLPVYDYSVHGLNAKLTAIATLKTADKGEIVSYPYEMYITNDNATGIDQIEADGIVLDFNAPVYNIQGQRVNPLFYRGIVMQNGKKFIIR